MPLRQGWRLVRSSEWGFSMCCILYGACALVITLVVSLSCWFAMREKYLELRDDEVAGRLMMGIRLVRLSAMHFSPHEDSHEMF